MTKQPVALIVDDEEDLCLLMQMTLGKMKIDSSVAYNLKDAKACLDKKTYNFCLTDLNLPDGSGLELVDYINQKFDNMPVAVITAHGNMDIAIEALKRGAFDFVNKPLELSRLRQIIENALKVTVQDKKTPTQTKDISHTKLLGKSAVIQQLRKTIKKLARSQAPVFLNGESGTGKEVVASLIHELSPRAEGNFVPVNCGAIPSELMESEFFGHKKGSFTGAVSDKQGLFQMAHNGTLFLDEVADLPLNMQVKLLRAIQEKKVRPIGGQQEIAVDIRLLSATHKDLQQLIQAGSFRQDLFYRINVIELKLPALNERGNDIMLLAEHFIQQISEDWQDEQIPSLSTQAKNVLLNHQYQGNVRELRNILERALTLCDGEQILPEHLQISDAPPTPSQNLQTSTPQSQANNDTGEHMALNEDIFVLPETPTRYPSDTSDNVNNQTHQQTHINQVYNKSNQNNHTQHPNHQTSDLTSPTQILIHIQDLPADGLEGYLQSEEKRLMLEALELCKWNRTKAADKLGMSFRSFRYRMKKLGIADD